MANLYPKARARKTPSNSLGLGAVPVMANPEFTSDAPMEPERDYDYGLERPEVQGSKTGNVIKTILDIGLPALVSGIDGSGALQGATAGYLGMRGRESREQDQAMDAFNKERAFRQKERDIDASSALASKKYELDQSYRDKMLELADRRVTSQEKKDGKATQPKPLSAEAAKTQEIARGGLTGVKTLYDKIGKGASLIMPGVFDRDTDAVMSDLADRIGRLRSGGAITADEEARFRGQIPGALDSADTKRKKLLRLNDMFKNINTHVAPEVTAVEDEVDQDELETILAERGL